MLPWRSLALTERPRPRRSASVINAVDKGVIGAVGLRVFSAAEPRGVGKAAPRRAVGYATTRVVFGRPTGASQGISLPLAEAHARLTAAELAIRRAAWRIDNDQTTSCAASSLT